MKMDVSCKYLFLLSQLNAHKKDEALLLLLNTVKLQCCDFGK